MTLPRVSLYEFAEHTGGKRCPLCSLMRQKLGKTQRLGPKWPNVNRFILYCRLQNVHYIQFFFSLGIWVLVSNYHQLCISSWSFCRPIHEPINLQHSSVVHGVPCCWCTEWEWILPPYSTRKCFLNISCVVFLEVLTK